MIISQNRIPPLHSFEQLMKQTDIILNQDACMRSEYYSKRSGKAVEQDVYSAICEASKGTEFENTIRLVSGASFPDIVANRFYGVEVKSTEKNQWTSIGSSILESTRVKDVTRIYLTFGKLGSPVEFLSRPYEDCLSGISVTHYPRYKIDMRLQKGETIFDKMGIPYDDIRQMENPVKPVSQYYRSKLKPGESLWWASDNEESIVPPTVRLWTTLSHQEKEKLTVQGYVLFPEILSSANTTKYNRYSLWLATQQGVINTNVRDSFSAGGKILMKTSSGVEIKTPAAFGRIAKYHHFIQEMLEEIDSETLTNFWEVPELFDNRILHWCQLAADASDSTIGYSVALNILSEIFSQ